MTTDTDIKQVVRERYASAAVAKTSCCGPKSCGGTIGPDLGLNMIGNAYQGVDGYLAEADLGLGCGLCRRGMPVSRRVTWSSTLVPVPGSTPS